MTRLGVALALLVTVLDQISKSWILTDVMFVPLLEALHFQAAPQNQILEMHADLNIKCPQVHISGK